MRTMLSRGLGILALGLGIGGFAPAIVHADVPQNPTFSRRIARCFRRSARPAIGQAPSRRCRCRPLSRSARGRALSGSA